MSSRTLSLDDRLYRYLLDHSLREGSVKYRLREHTRTHELARMQISPEQGQFMALLVELIGARQALEIGTFTGYSALCIAEAMPPDGRLVCCDLSEEWTAIGIPFWEEAGVRDRIDLRIAPALDTLSELGAERGESHFDFVFIDADKQNYLNYYEACLPLVRAGGLLLFDNTLWSGAVADPDDQEADTRALRSFNEAIHRDDRVAMSLVPIGDGLTLALKG